MRFLWDSNSSTLLLEKEFLRKSLKLCLALDYLSKRYEVKATMGAQCASMKGYVNDVQNPTDFYMLCAAHVLKLIISKTFNAADIANCVSAIKGITTFVRGSAKHMKVLHT